jgi:hypothetical protein
MDRELSSGVYVRDYLFWDFLTTTSLAGFIGNIFFSSYHNFLSLLTIFSLRSKSFNRSLRIFFFLVVNILRFEYSADKGRWSNRKIPYLLKKLQTIFGIQLSPIYYFHDGEVFI